jgi:NaMN:DMB phosphoribosyltransferase
MKTMGELPRLAAWRATPEGDRTPPHNKYSQFFMTEAEVLSVSMLTARAS